MRSISRRSSASDGGLDWDGFPMRVVAVFSRPHLKGMRGVALIGGAKG
jgi:hypothetical protein